MDHRLDTLARTLTAPLSRRQAFWRLGGGLAAAFLASVGIARADQNSCAAACAHCCQTLDPPPRGEELAECITTCLDGGGPCGGRPGTCK
jgi:hypothetical protein